MTMKTLAIVLGAAIAALLSLAPVRADVPMTGNFLAAEACPAEQSFNKHFNPGSVMLTRGQTYAIVSANNTPASHYLVMVPGATPERRWVAEGCGSVVATSDSITTLPASTGGSPSSTTLAPPSTPAAAARPASGPAPGAGTYVLAISWEPGFCVSHDTAECRAETPTGFDASHFTLHGLWRDPQKRYSYCGNDGRSYKSTDLEHNWSDLPEVTLDPAVRAHLDQVMPGTQSSLERHEWIEHGTCSETDMNAYFARATALLDLVNTSAVRTLVAGRVGQPVSLDEIRTAFDQAFGTDAGRRVSMSCAGGGHFLTEIQIALQGDVMGNAAMKDLMAAALPASGGSCASGMVRAVK
jgi:ribonuclease T2